MCLCWHGWMEPGRGNNPQNKRCAARAVWLVLCVYILALHSSWLLQHVSDSVQRSWVQLRCPNDWHFSSHFVLRYAYYTLGAVISRFYLMNGFGASLNMYRKSVDVLMFSALKTKDCTAGARGTTCENRKHWGSERVSAWYHV